MCVKKDRNIYFFVCLFAVKKVVSFGKKSRFFKDLRHFFLNEFTLRKSKVDELGVRNLGLGIPGQKRPATK